MITITSDRVSSFFAKLGAEVPSADADLNIDRFERGARPQGQATSTFCAVAPTASDPA
ncbi:hypothetical protein [Amycolatopsis suaedae]|uniref:hypothetical protein n=1 Tax=Amycolatopsis suaedae TaxID=2510978 RepID=UPI0013EF4C5F|nr:hypothetical protein [Amycolatopsis suaedae]